MEALINSKTCWLILSLTITKLGMPDSRWQLVLLSPLLSP